MDPLSAVLMVVRAVRCCLDMAEACQENKAMCRRLAQRVGMLEGPLNEVASGALVVAPDALKRTEMLCNDIQAFLRTFTVTGGTTKLKQAFNHQKIALRFAELNQHLNDLVLDLQFRACAEKLANREAEDLHDMREDFDRLHTTLEALAAQLTAQNDRAEIQDRRAEAQHREVMSALQRMRLDAPVQIVGFQEVTYESLRADESRMGCLGRGGFGVVLSGIFDHQVVAIKRLLDDGADQKTVREMRKELRIHAELRHPCIVQLLAACTVGPDYALVMELAPFGSVHRQLRQRAHQPPLPIEAKIKLLHDAASGAAYLHKRGVVHGDLKCLNLLVFEPCKAKVCDFGLASVKTSDSRASKNRGVGTIGWMAPEVGRGNKPTTAADVYSFGMIIFEFLAEEVPFARLQDEQVAYQVAFGQRPELSQQREQDAPPGLMALMRRCWQQDPELRPTCDTIAREIAILRDAMPMGDRPPPLRRLSLRSRSVGGTLVPQPAPLGGWQPRTVAVPEGTPLPPAVPATDRVVPPAAVAVQQDPSQPGVNLGENAGDNPLVVATGLRARAAPAAVAPGTASPADAVTEFYSSDSASAASRSGPTSALSGAGAVGSGRAGEGGGDSGVLGAAATAGTAFPLSSPTGKPGTASPLAPLEGETRAAEEDPAAPAVAYSSGGHTSGHPEWEEGGAAGAAGSAHGLQRREEQRENPAQEEPRRPQEQPQPQPQQPLPDRPQQQYMAITVAQAMAVFATTPQMTDSRRSRPLSGGGGLRAAWSAAKKLVNSSSSPPAGGSYAANGVADGPPPAHSSLGSADSNASGTGVNCLGIVTAMAAHPQNRDVQLKGCAAVASAAFDNADDAMQLGEANASQAVVAAMRNFPGVVVIQEQGARALASLAFADDVSRRAIGACGGCEVVVAALRAHTRQAAVQDHACKALHALAYGSAENSARLLDLDALAVVREAIGRASASKGSHAHAIREWGGKAERLLIRARGHSRSVGDANGGVKGASGIVGGARSVDATPPHRGGRQLQAAQN